MTKKEFEEYINKAADKYFSLKNNPHDKDKLVFKLWKMFNAYPRLQYPDLYRDPINRESLINAAEEVFRKYILEEKYDPEKGKISFLLNTALLNAKKKIIDKNIKEEKKLKASKDALKEKLEEEKNKFLSDRDDVTPDIIKTFLESTDTGMEFFTHTKTSKERSNSDTEWVKQILTHTWHPGIISFEDNELSHYKFVCIKLLHEIVTFRKETHSKKFSQQKLADKCGREKSSYNKTRERYAKSCIKHGEKEDDIVLFTLGNTLMKFKKPEEFCKQIAYRKI